MDITRIAVPTPLDIESVNCFLVDDDGVTLIDGVMASDAAATSFYRRLEAEGYLASDIDRILITHPHIDHFGLAGEIKEESGASVYAHPDATGWLRDLDLYYDRKREHLFPYLRSLGVPTNVARSMVHTPTGAYSDMWGPVETDVEITGGDVVDVGTELAVVETPGHCPASVSFVDTAGRRAFVGDTIVDGFVPTPLIMLKPGTETRTRSLPTWVRSLEDMRAFDLDIAYGGHFDPVTDVPGRIDGMIEQFQDGADRAAETLQTTGPLTAYQLHTEIYESHAARDRLAFLSVTVGHLDLLETRDRVTKRRINDEWLYDVASATHR
jgi:glyoxylase-like metal-dependent hydrolase (beta-lactamase superfamily II)